MESSCPTCASIFIRPECIVKPDDSMRSEFFERDVEFTAHDLRASAGLDCLLCLSVWEDFQAQYKQLQSLPWKIDEKTVIQTSLGWSRRALGKDCATEEGGDGDQKNLSCSSLTYHLRSDDNEKAQLYVKVEVWPEFAVEASVTNPDQIPEDSSSNAVSLTREWLEECVRSHKECHIPNPGWLPTRLIAVGLANSVDDPKLVESTHIHKKGRALPRYLALSHRWGTSTVFKLETTNRDELMKRIPMDGLSITFKDAIDLARQLNIPYLWIDSLCIIQDSPEDWRNESTLMNKVYKHSVCNIAASAASDTTGLYRLRDRQTINSMITTKRLVRRKDGGGMYFFSSSSNEFEAAPPGPLYGRAWVFQERLLSPRSVHFSTQLFWECRQKRACETYPQRMPQGPDFTRFNTKAKAWENELVGERALVFWQELVENYVNCELTFPTDRLIAMAGIAEEFRQILKKDEYLVGMWRTHMPQNLVWAVKPRNWWDPKKSDPFPTRPEMYRCPTWSWVSLDFKSAEFTAPPPLPFGTHMLARVITTPVESSTNNPFTTLDSSFIKLKGRLREINVEVFDSKGLVHFVVESAKARNPAQFPPSALHDPQDKYGRDTDVPFWLDLGEMTFAGELKLPRLYLLPIMRQFSNVYSLVLRRGRHQDALKSGGADTVGGFNQVEKFERIGTSKICVHSLANTVPEGLEWVEKFVRLPDPLGQPLETVTIY